MAVQFWYLVHLFIDMQSIKKFFSAVALDMTGHAEKFISAAGGFVGILLTMWISLKYLGAQGAAMLVASMGASDDIGTEPHSLLPISP